MQWYFSGWEGLFKPFHLIWWWSKHLTAGWCVTFGNLILPGTATGSTGRLMCRLEVIEERTTQQFHVTWFSKLTDARQLSTLWLVIQKIKSVSEHHPNSVNLSVLSDIFEQSCQRMCREAVMHFFRLDWNRLKLEWKLSFQDSQSLELPFYSPIITLYQIHTTKMLKSKTSRIRKASLSKAKNLCCGSTSHNRTF